jgi:hypothetical protein
MVLVVDQEPVGAFASDGTDPAFGDRVRPRGERVGVRITRAPSKVNVIEDTLELRTAVPDEEPHAFGSFIQTMTRLRACWVTHAPVGFAVTPAICTARVGSGGVLNEEQNVDPLTKAFVSK